jgi:hypothetical protein
MNYPAASSGVSQGTLIINSASGGELNPSELSNFINKNRLIAGKFNWQEGFGAFSYSHSHIEKVIKYILNQEKHHQKTTHTSKK